MQCLNKSIMKTLLTLYINVFHDNDDLNCCQVVLNYSQISTILYVEENAKSSSLNWLNMLSYNYIASCWSL